MKKCSFYTRKAGGIVERVNGWTDGKYNYYKTGDMWFCIVPDIGIAAVTGNSRKDVVTQVYAPDVAAKISAIMDRDGATLREKFNSLIQAAENN